jgi:hypothetical protein
LIAIKEINMDDLLPVFQRLGQASVGQEFVSLRLSLGKPNQFEYTIRTFVDEEGATDPKVFRKRMALYHGVDFNYSYEMFGKLSYPDELAGLDCRLEVNPLAGSDFLEYGPHGFLGFGYVETDCIVVSLYLAPEAARGIIDRQIIEDRLRTSPSASEEWTSMRIDIVDYKRGEKVPYENKTTFRIVRVYC